MASDRPRLRPASLTALLVLAFLALSFPLLALPSRAEDRASYFERHATGLARRGDPAGAAVLRELGALDRTVPRVLSPEAAARLGATATRYESLRQDLRALIARAEVADALAWRLDRAEADLHLAAYEMEKERFSSRDVKNALNDAAWILGGLPRPAAVVVGPAPEILRFAASRERIVSGESVSLSWMVTDADAVRLNGRDVAAEGTLVDQPAATAYYKLEAIGPGGKAEAGLYVSVSPASRAPQPRIVLSAHPPVIYLGESVVIRWRAVNAETLTLDGRLVSFTDSAEFAPAVTTRYQAEAKGRGGQSASTVEVVVLVPRQVPALSEPSTLETGAVGETVAREPSLTASAPAEEPPSAPTMLRVIVQAGGDRLVVTTTIRHALDALAAELATRPTARLRIEGHTDDVGSEEANRALSVRRAEIARRDFCRRYGVPIDRIEVRGVGESTPLVPNIGPDGRPDSRARRQNRRVEFLLVP